MLRQRYSVKHISHDDADGLGGIILSLNTFEDVDYEYCTYDDINPRLVAFAEKYLEGARKDKQFDYIVVTDIGITKETADLLDRINTEYSNKTKVVYLDHHPPNVWMNRYSWANVQSTYSQNGEIFKTAGTSLWFEYLDKNNLIVPGMYKTLADFSETIRLWDTWEWVARGAERARELSDLLYMRGRSKFIDRFFKNPSIELDTEEIFLLTEEKGRIDRYIQEKKQEVKFIQTGSGYHVAVVFAELYTSILGNQLCKAFPNVDFTAVLTPSNGRASFRTIREDINLGKMMSESYDGGGHPKTAGCPLHNVFTGQFDLSKI